MKKYGTAIFALVLLAGLISLNMASASTDQGKAAEASKTGRKQIRIGIDVLLHEQIDLIKGKNVGLITNPTGVNQDLISDVDLLFNHPDVNLVAMYGPEHGVRGDQQAGGYVPSYIDEKTGVPVYSLYGQTKKPTPEMLENVEVLIFDIQDVGSRFYTYIYTMAYAMEAAAENDIPFIVLDRPNPINGIDVQGPVLEEDYSSFVGMYPIPLRHGMTAGELAGLFNKEFSIDADLSVVRMKGWDRSTYYDDTPLKFILPSPNMPTVETTVIYPGAALIEGTNLSEGRGTTKPFEFIGAPWIDAVDLADRLNDLKLQGVQFRAAHFTPTYSKFDGELCHGIQIHVTDRKSFDPLRTGLSVVKTVHDMYPDQLTFRESHFNNLIGNGWVLEEIQNGTPVKEIEKKWRKDLNAFKKIRKNYLLY